MRLLTLEHSRFAYHADLVLYGAGLMLLAAYLLVAAPRAHGFEIAALAGLGLLGWTLIEYLLHRFVLHGVQPFARWHLAHHHRPRALICSPTIFSATLIALLVFLPALAVGNLWWACAWTLGVTSGYLAYALTHHATHHWRADGAWLKQRKRWHALHHHREAPACFGVTSPFWDHVFGSAAA